MLGTLLSAAMDKDKSLTLSSFRTGGKRAAPCKHGHT